MDSADEIPQHLLKEHGIDTFPSISFSKENKFCYGNKMLFFCYCYILLTFTGKAWDTQVG